MCSISERTCSIPIALSQPSTLWIVRKSSSALRSSRLLEAEPPEQGLYFTIPFHDAETTKHERVGKPLGTGCGQNTKAYCLSYLLSWSTPFAIRFRFLEDGPRQLEGCCRLNHEAAKGRLEQDRMANRHSLPNRRRPSRDIFIHARAGMLRALNVDKPPDRD
jgi:hypothetical protein